MEHSKAFEMPPHNKEYPHRSKHPFVAGGSGGPASQQGITTGGGDTFLAERAAHAYMEGTKPFVTKCKEAEHHPTTKAKPEKNNTEVEHEIKRRHEKEKYGFSNKMPHTK